jgi:membrane-bound ClpP family serine protease
MLSIIIALFILGMVLVSFELIVPGGILGLLGVLSIMGSWVLAFIEYGIHGGMIAVVASVVIMTLSLAIELKLVPRTRIGQRLFLNRSIDSTSHGSLAAPDLVGQEGEALTTLAPTGVVIVDGRKYEAFSMSGLVERGTRLEVVDYDNFRVRVKKI